MTERLLYRRNSQLQSFGDGLDYIVHFFFINKQINQQKLTQKVYGKLLKQDLLMQHRRSKTRGKTKQPGYVCKYV